MSYDEDPPTRRLPVPPREPLPRERVPPAEPAAPGSAPPGAISEVQLYDLEQRLRSLRAWLTALALVAVLALLVAAVALATAGGDDDPPTSSARTPAALRESVEKLEQRVDDRATKGQLSGVKDDLAALQKSVAAAESSGDATTTATTEAPDISGLQSSLSDLTARVEALEDAGPADGTATDTTAP